MTELNQLLTDLRAAASNKAQREAIDEIDNLVANRGYLNDRQLLHAAQLIARPSFPDLLGDIDDSPSLLQTLDTATSLAIGGVSRYFPGVSAPTRDGDDTEEAEPGAPTSDYTQDQVIALIRAGVDQGYILANPDGTYEDYEFGLSIDPTTGWMETPPGADQPVHLEHYLNTQGSVTGFLDDGTAAPPPAPDIRPTPIGVPVPPTGQFVAAPRVDQTMLPESDGSVSAPLRTGVVADIDATAIYKFMSSKTGTETISYYQSQLVKAGLLEPGSYSPGKWDGPTRYVMENRVAADANFEGYAEDDNRNIQLAITNLAAHPIVTVDDPGDVFRRQAFQRPNRQDTEFDLKRTVRSAIGRDPSAAELADLADYWEQRLLVSHEAGEDIRLSEWQRDQDIEGGDLDVIDTAGDPREISLERDPQTAFDEYFRNVFPGAETFAKRSSESRSSTDRVLGIMGRLVG